MTLNYPFALRPRIHELCGAFYATLLLLVVSDLQIGGQKAYKLLS